MMKSLKSGLVLQMVSTMTVWKMMIKK